MPHKKQIFEIGELIGKCSFLRDASKSGERRIIWAKCPCGTEFKSRLDIIKKGFGCGCNQGENWLTSEQIAAWMTTHGYTGTPEYNVWNSMRNRCDNPKTKAYRLYGGRGISYSPEWAKFENFIRDMGDRPSKKHSLERIDNEGNYEKSNCKWATKPEQAKNTRLATVLTVDGETGNLWYWYEKYGIHPRVSKKRLKMGWDAKKAITHPKRIFKEDENKVGNTGAPFV